jgi:hypothetical protein
VYDQLAAGATSNASPSVDGLLLSARYGACSFGFFTPSSPTTARLFDHMNVLFWHLPDSFRSEWMLKH